MISIIICTRNRFLLLKSNVLSLLESLKHASLSYEIIIVDDSDTKVRSCDLLESSLLSNPVTLTVIVNDFGGPAHGRNLGAMNARGDWLIFLDDDAKVPHHYLHHFEYLLSAHALTSHCFGGPIIPYYSEPRPSWFKDEYETRYFGTSSRYLVKPEVFSGGNMIWKKSTFIQLGGLNPNLGPRGGMFSTGEETALFHLAWHNIHDFSCYYSPELFIYHHTPLIKTSSFYFLHRCLLNGQSRYRFADTSNKNKGFIGFHYCFFMSFLLFTGAFGKLFFYKNVNNWVFEQLGRPVTLLGTLLAIISIRVKSIHQ